MVIRLIYEYEFYIGKERIKMAQEKFWENTIIDSEKLGIFVYALTDDENNIFYVGKGGGTGEGNKRPEDHLSDAKKNPDSESEKIKRINSIWKKKKMLDC